jgi:hypothetical protein
MGKIIGFLRDRLDERSTWRALVALLTIAGISFDPEQTQAIIAAGVAIGALLEALLPDPAGNVRVKRVRAELPGETEHTERGISGGSPKHADDYLGDFRGDD